MKVVCEKCGKVVDQSEVMQTLYGEHLCELCWDDYICTDRGKIEYYVDIATEKYPISLFDADFLGEVHVSWEKHKHEIYSDVEILMLEQLMTFKECLAAEQALHIN